MSSIAVGRVGPEQRAAMERFLAAHAEVTMFLRGNLARAGLRDGPAKYRGVYMAAWEGDDVVGVAAHYWNGSLVLYAPAGLTELAQAAVQVSGRRVAGILGPYPQVEEATEALGLAGTPRRLNSREILYALDLHAMTLPELGEELSARIAGPADLPVLVPWRREYERGLGLFEASDAELRDRLAQTLEAGDTWILERGDVPVATTGFNARLPDAVQIGGVFTPAEERSRGYGRQVVARSLEAERAKGVTRAILFTGTDNQPARRAYEALGFESIGTYGLRFFAPS
ncbi:MAG: GNAT family N-acetyltransferase [Myxococcota bacterium]